MLSCQIVRQKTIELSMKTGAGHLASSLSCVEILVTLFNYFLKYDVKNPTWESRDRLIFSKGHGAYAYYVILNSLGFIPDCELENFYTEKSSLKGCVCRNPEYMLEASTGSLGHGLPIAVGIAKALKMKNLDSKVICLVGDGEMQEGSNFEALSLAYRFRLNNLLIIVDANNLQAMDFVKNVGLDNERLASVLKAYCDERAFEYVNGHNEEQLKGAFYKFFNNPPNSFTIVFCRTVKGKGLKILENKPQYHFRCPSEDGYNIDDLMKCIDDER